MKRNICILFLLMFLACQEKASYDLKFAYIDNYSGDIISLIEHPYIFQEQGYKIEYFTLTKEAEGNLFSLSLTGNLKDINKDHFFYVHGYENAEKENFINLDLQHQTKINATKIIFTNTFTDVPIKFERLEFGLADLKKKKRLFTLTVNDVSLMLPQK